MRKLLYIKLSLLIFSFSFSTLAEMQYESAFATIFYRGQLLIEITDIKIVKKELYIDLNEVAEVLYLEKNYQIEDRKIKGYFDDPDQIFDYPLNIQDCHDTLLFIKDNDERIFTSIGFINEHSNLNISGDTASLNININPTDNLAFERYKQFDDEYQKKLDAPKIISADLSNAPYQGLSLPKIRISNRSAESTESEFVNQTTVSTEFDILWTHAQLSVTKNLKDKENYFFRTEKIFMENEENDLFISEVKLGDVNSIHIPQSSMVTGRGIVLNSTSQKANADNNSIFIEGFTAPNQLLEVYTNGNLSDRIRSDDRGYYSANINNVYIGLNEIKVVQLDNYGSQVIDIEQYYNTGNILKSGSLEYSYSFIDSNNTSISHEHKPEKYQHSYIIRYGLFEDLSIFHGGNHYLKSSDHPNIEEQNELIYGLDHRFFIFAHDFTYKLGDDSKSYSYSVGGDKVAHFNYSANWQWIDYDDEQYYKGYERNFHLMFTGIDRMSLSGEYLKSEKMRSRDLLNNNNYVEVEEISYSLNLTHRILKMRLSGVQDKVKDILNAEAQLRTNFYRFDLESTLYFNDVETHKKLSNYVANLTYKMSQSNRVYTQVSGDPKRISQVKLGFTGEIFNIDYDLHGGHRPDDIYFGGLNWTIKFAPSAEGYKLLSRYEYNKGVIEVIAFVDNNGNGIRDNDEETLEGVSFRLGHNQDIATTNAEGHATITGIMDNQQNSLLIDSVNENIGYTPRYKKHDFKGRGTYMGKIFFPFEQLLYVEGTLKGIRNKKELKNSIYLENTDTQERFEVSVLADGYFFVEMNQFGSYRIVTEHCTSKPFLIEWVEGGYQELGDILTTCKK
tara:strand:- start:8373 stop:10901 length:2529 start_codon:yes stop_codon:yes gene_type:complete